MFIHILLSKYHTLIEYEIKFQDFRKQLMANLFLQRKKIHEIVNELGAINSRRRGRGKRRGVSTRINSLEINLTPSGWSRPKVFSRLGLPESL